MWKADKGKSRRSVDIVTPTPTDKNLLAAHIGSRRNSLDLIRLISASLVIIGHSYAIVGWGTDPMARWNGSVYTGLFALHVFFFISGLLVPIVSCTSRIL